MVSQRFPRSDFNCSALAWTASRLTELRDTPTVCAISGRTSSYSRVETPRSIAPQRVPRAAQLRLRVAARSIQLRIGISRRLVRAVLALCPVEVRTIPVIGAVIAPEAFLRRPRLDRRAIDGEVFWRSWPGSNRELDSVGPREAVAKLVIMLSCKAGQGNDLPKVQHGL